MGTPRTRDSELDVPTSNQFPSKQQSDGSLVGNYDNVKDRRYSEELAKSSADNSDRPRKGQNSRHELPAVGETSNFDVTVPEDQNIVYSIFNPSLCLFCVHHTSGLDETLVHMQTRHGLSIPEQDRLIHLESFIRYLFTVVFDFNECIYCGVTKGTAKGVQQHMLTKAHCKISKPEKGSEYLDFFDLSDAEGDDENDVGPAITEELSIDRDSLIKSAEDFVRLSSGRTLGHRLTKRGPRHTPLQGGHGKSIGDEKISSDDATTVSNTEGSEPPPRARGQLMSRTNDDKALVGVPEWQRRALRAAEKKMVRVEIRARNRYEAAVQRAADQRPDLRRRRVTRVPDSV